MLQKIVIGLFVFVAILFGLSFVLDQKAIATIATVAIAAVGVYYFANVAYAMIVKRKRK